MTRLAVLEFAFELHNDRLPSGSWEDEHPTLKSVVVTEQVLLLLARIAPSLFSVSLDNGWRWLCGSEVEKSEGAAWRPLPLLLARADPAKVEATLNFTRQLVERGVRVDPNSPLLPFYVDMLARLDDFDDLALRIIEGWTNDLATLTGGPETEVGSGPRAWKPNMLTHVLAALAAANHVEEEVALAVLRLVEGRARGPSPQCRCWEDLNMTAYTTLNLIRFRELRHNAPPNEADYLADRLIDGGLGYVVQRWEEDDFTSGAVAGGDTDFAYTRFHKVVAARVLVEGLRREDSAWTVSALADQRAAAVPAEVKPEQTDMTGSAFLLISALVSITAAVWQMLAERFWLGCVIIAITVALAVRRDRTWRWRPPVSELLLLAAIGVVAGLAAFGLETLVQSLADDSAVSSPSPNGRER